MTETVRRIVMLAVMLLVFVIGTDMLVQQYLLFKRAYFELEYLISHPSIETGDTSWEEE